MFHLCSLKETPPKRLCQSITSSREVEATVYRKEPPPSIQPVEYSTASKALDVHTMEPFQLIDFNFPKILCGKQNCAFSIKVGFGISLASP